VPSVTTGPVESTLEDGSRAAGEILAGEPGPSARRWLGPLSLISFLLFVVVTILVVTGVTRSGFDLPVERAVQHVPWGPLTYWMTLTNVTGGLIVKVSVARHRPTADVVTILNPSSGYSYPSGHALFFTWLAFMLAIAISPHVGPRWRVITWIVAGLVILFACIGRIWAGAHWPTDVIAGFLLGVAWSAFILWLPERWLPTPSRRWFPARRSASRRSHA
jgi:membrane-associated phospholipid phosphatase